LIFYRTADSSLFQASYKTGLVLFSDEERPGRQRLISWLNLNLTGACLTSCAASLGLQAGEDVQPPGYISPTATYQPPGGH